MASGGILDLYTPKTDTGLIHASKGYIGFNTLLQSGTETLPNMLMIVVMTALMMCVATSEIGTSSENTDLRTSAYMFWNENRVLNDVSLVLHEEDMSKSVKCDYIEKG